MLKWLRKKNVIDYEKMIAPVAHKKILIVEDNELNATLMTDLLAAHGYSTRLIDEGNKVVALTREFQPDLILMDIQLPDISGLEVAKWIKDETDLKKIPIVAVTAFAMKGDEKMILDNGCKAYIAKPITVTTFIDTISQILAGTYEKPVRKTKRDNDNVDKEAIKIVDDEAREKRNAYQRKYRRRKKNKIRCFLQTNEQLELIASLWAEGMSAQEISETIGYLNRYRVLGTIHRLGLGRRGELSEVKPASKTTSQ